MMLWIRPYRPHELPLILERGVETALAQLVKREMPGATRQGVASQLALMYERALATPGATILAADWTEEARPVAGGGGAPGGQAVPGGPVAHTLLMPEPNPFTGESELIVLDIYTHPALRGRGAGRALLQKAMEHAAAIGCRSLVAQVALHNQASLALFSRAGFELERTTVGRRL